MERRVGNVRASNWPEIVGACQLCPSSLQSFFLPIVADARVAYIDHPCPVSFRDIWWKCVGPKHGDRCGLRKGVGPCRHKV